VGKTIGTLAALVAAGAVGGIAFVYSGFYDVGADKPHWPGVWRLRLPLMRSSEKMHEAFLVRSAQIRDRTNRDGW
jgi:hypothetical protein